MRRLLLTCSVVALLVLGVTASAALAYTKGQAEQTADSYASLHYPEAQEGSCTSSGKNKAGEAQWYCSGKYEFGTKTWHVNVGPYGEITYHNP